MEWYYIVAIIVGALFVWLILSALLYKQFFKRFYDILLSGIAIIALSPILLILTIIGAIVMKGNPFFTQLRPGKNEKIFKLIKFRSMTCAKDKDGNLLPDEQRLVKYGKILRNTSLDELPELFNIFLGHMSIVGPRPLLVRDMVFMSENQRNRHIVRPGLTGLAQVNGRNNISWEKKFIYDIEYIKKITFIKDLKILWLTAINVVKRKDVDREGTVSDIDFGDYLLKNKNIDLNEYNKKQLEAKNILTNL